MSTRATHHHESWMIRDNGEGGTYCAACGEPLTGRYVVTSDFGKGPKVIYRGEIRDRAIEVTNFWDERQNTWLTDTAEIAAAGKAAEDALPAVEWAMLQFDRLEARILGATS